MKPEFWKNKRVLVTGHTGFKGSWLVIWLKNLGADVYGISLEPDPATKNLFDEARIDTLCSSQFCDIRNDEKIQSAILGIQPEIVFHLAAQALVRDGYSDPMNTFSTNIMGTVNILQAIRKLARLKVAVMVTTDKVYKNREWVWPYREEDELGGVDPYSASKAACELVISSFRDSFLKKQGIAVATARAGNVVGGGDWSKDRLIPDAIEAWHQEKKVVIRSPNSTRPWQHVLEPLAGYIALAEQLWFAPNLAGAYNFGPSAAGTKTVDYIVNLANKIYGDSSAVVYEGSDGPHEAGLLALDPSKAGSLLDVRCILDVDETIEKTIDWYLSHAKGIDALKLCEDDIELYSRLL